MSEMVSDSTVRHQHSGEEWDIPVSLLEAQRRWDEADAACTHLASAGDPAAYESARARRLTEALALHRHPWLLEQQQAGRRFQADQAVKQLARAAVQKADLVEST